MFDFFFPSPFFSTSTTMNSSSNRSKKRWAARASTQLCETRDVNSITTRYANSRWKFAFDPATYGFVPPIYVILSFFLFLFFFYRVCVRRLLLPFNIYEHFPGRRYKLLLYSLFTFNSTFYFPFRVPVSLLLFTLAGNELEGNQDARLFVRMEKRSYFERGSINIY